MYNYCPCGSPLKNKEVEYIIVEYNKEGEIVFAVCSHGYVVINNIDEKKEEEI